MNMNCKALILSGACLLGAPFHRLAAQPASPGATIKSSTQNVLVDVVVRDKKGRSVTDLKEGDFEISDNGQGRKIESFRLVQGTEAVGASGARTTLDPLRQIRLVTLIFDRLDMNARRLAREAALEVIKSELPQNVYMAVMTIDQRLQAVQQFTNNRDLLKKGIDRATSSGVSDYSADSAQVRSQVQSLAGTPQNAQSLQEQVDNMSTGATATSGPGAAPNASAIVAQLTAVIMLRMLEAQQGMADAAGGRASIYALLTAVKEQYRLPGRKTILYFSEGFRIPQGMEEPFRSVITMANRSNVSFYAIEASGLGMEGGNANASSELASAAAASRTSMNRSGAVSQEQVKSQDKALDSAGANTENILENLASSTGGTLIANTNDFKGPLRRISEDIQTYYEISYNPAIEHYDGSFHKIGVKLARSDFKVQSRSGYFALPASLTRGTVPVSGYEVSLLQALEAPTLPATFQFQAMGLHFRGAGPESTAEVILDVPLGNLTFDENKAAKIYEGHLTYVILVKNSSGDVVKKFQNDIPLKVPAAKIQALKESHFTFAEHFTADPGKYTVEAAVSDQAVTALGGSGTRLSAQKSSFELPPNSGTLGISSVGAIRNLKDKLADSSPDDPLLMADKLVTLTLNPVIDKAVSPTLPFYVVIYPAKGNATALALEMEFSKDGQILGSGRPPLSLPDKDGRIQYVATAPLASLAPGNYKIRFIVQQGTETAQESVGFVLK